MKTSRTWGRRLLRTFMCPASVMGWWFFLVHYLHESQALVFQHYRPSQSRSIQLIPGYSGNFDRAHRTMWSSLARTTQAIPAITVPPRPTATSSIEKPFATLGISPRNAFLLIKSFLRQVKITMTALTTKALAWYLYQLSAHPVVVKSLTAGMIGMVGDAIAQYLTGKSHYHLRRGLALMVDGVASGPFLHVGYEWMERIVPTKAPNDEKSSSIWYSHLAAVVHVLADCLVLDSIFVAMTIALTGVLEGIPNQLLIQQFRTDYYVTLQASWITSAVLFPLQFCMFRFLPLRWRVLAVNFLDVIWDAVLSLNAHRSRVFL